MASITIEGEELGRLAAETIIRRSSTESDLKRHLAAFQVFLEQSVALKKQEEGGAAATAFEQAARAAITDRLTLYAEQAKHSTRTDQ